MTTSFPQCTLLYTIPYYFTMTVTSGTIRNAPKKPGQNSRHTFRRHSVNTKGSKKFPPGRRDTTAQTTSRGTILTGYREPATKLWAFPNAYKPQPLMQKGKPRIKAVLPGCTMKYTLTFLHQSMESPTTRTLIKSIGNKNLSTWLFMTESNIHKFLPHSIPISQVHQDRIRKNSQSTTPHPTTDDRKQELKKIDIYSKINQPEIPSVKIHSDQTGRFLIQSNSGNKYLMVIYTYEPNAILLEPLQ